MHGISLRSIASNGVVWGVTAEVDAMIGISLKGIAGNGVIWGGRKVDASSSCLRSIASNGVV